MDSKFTGPKPSGYIKAGATVEAITSVIQS